jgi:hypothetical protein
VERQHALGAGFDEIIQLIPMTSLVLEQREHEKLGASFFEIGSEHGGDISGDDGYVRGNERTVNRVDGGEIDF